MNLNLVTPLGLMGHGYVGRYILHELTTAGVHVALFPVGNPGYFNQNKQDPVGLGLLNATQYDPKAPSVRICPAMMQAEHVGRGKHVGFPFFELDHFETGAIHHLRQLDVILVASRWAAGVVAAHDLKVPTAVVPLGVDRTVFHEAINAGERERNVGPTVFVNTGKWEKRKGHDFLLEAFCHAFTPRDNVLITLLSSNYTLAQQDNDTWARMFLNSAVGSRVRLIPRLPNHHEVAKLIAGADCGVFPSRAEGWNLGLLECMSVGLNVIATDYSAHTEFATEANCRLVHVVETEPVQDAQWLAGQGSWAKLGTSQMEQMVHHLREVHRLKQEGVLPRNEAGIATAKAFPWRRSAESLLQAVQ
jgi:glycosyltransferase involved in cell wall biosynthesis